LIIFELGGVRVIEGNYEAYQLFLKSKAEEGKLSSQPTISNQQEKKHRQDDSKPAAAGKKRRFPYRKVSDIEADIFRRESRIEQLNEEMGDPATFRDGGRIRAIKQELTDQQSALKKLYEHWEEAAEMN
jgi:ATP-binding cassette subfamily F protein 3